jgi:hypothetical protein
MKKFAIVIAVTAFLMMSAPVSAMDLTGMFSVGGVAGYGIGFGDAFEDYELEGFSSSSSLGILFGGNASYFFTPDMGVTVGATYQTWKCEWESPAGSIIPSGEETENWIGINANGTYVLMPESNTRPYVSAGPTFYIFSAEGSDSKIGFNAGGGVFHFFTPQAALNVGGAFHMIPSAYETLKEGSMTETESKALTAFQFFVGFSYFFGTTN